MIQMVAIDSFEPTTLYEYMEAHGLISSGLKTAPARIIDLQRVTSYCIWNDGDNPLALMLEIPLPEKNCMEIMVIPEDRELGKRKQEIIEFGHRMRDRWFGALGMRRIQAHVPASRVNMHRIMRSLGFMLETPKGLRNAIMLGENPENLMVYGMLVTDPPRVWYPEQIPQEALN